MKDSFIISGLDGKRTLSGTLEIGGAKNAVLPLMAGSIAAKGPITITNVPEIEDVRRMCELMHDLGISVRHDSKKRQLELDATNIKTSAIDYEISKRLRASIILTGPILARLGKVSFPHPGGCVIGARPIDLFIEGFKKMGATVRTLEKSYEIKAKGGKLVGGEIFFKNQSVTATETFIIAGVLAKGVTVLKNCALEPEIVNLAEMLKALGADIEGAGTLTITIRGGELLKPVKDFSFKTIPDRIEAGSFLILGALCAKDLKIANCLPEHLLSLIETLKSAGVDLEVGQDWIRVKNKTQSKSKSDNKKSQLKAVNIKTHEYPGFPTDLQAPLTVFLTQASGESLVFETIFEGRLNYTQDLVKMGADIAMWDTNRVMVKGPTPLKAKELEGPDIRAGLAFLIAGLVAKGESVLNNIYYIDRGYENIENRLKTIGANVKRISC